MFGLCVTQCVCYNHIEKPKGYTVYVGQLVNLHTYNTDNVVLSLLDDKIKLFTNKHTFFHVLTDKLCKCLNAINDYDERMKFHKNTENREFVLNLNGPTTVDVDVDNNHLIARFHRQVEESNKIYFIVELLEQPDEELIKKLKRACHSYQIQLTVTGNQIQKLKSCQNVWKLEYKENVGILMYFLWYVIEYLNNKKELWVCETCNRENWKILKECRYCQPNSNFPQCHNGTRHLVTEEQSITNEANFNRNGNGYDPKLSQNYDEENDRDDTVQNIQPSAPDMELDDLNNNNNKAVGTPKGSALDDIKTEELIGTEVIIDCENQQIDPPPAREESIKDHPVSTSESNEQLDKFVYDAVIDECNRVNGFKVDEECSLNEHIDIIQSQEHKANQQPALEAYKLFLNEISDHNDIINEPNDETKSIECDDHSHVNADVENGPIHKFWTCTVCFRTNKIGDNCERCDEKPDEILPESDRIHEFANDLIDHYGITMIQNEREAKCMNCQTSLEFSKGFILQLCSHLFCEICIKSQISTYIGENHKLDELTCCAWVHDKMCNRRFELWEIKYFLTDQIAYDQFINRLIHANETNLYIKMCYDTNCSGYYLCESYDRPWPNDFVCNKCNWKNCLQCKVIHDGLNCIQYGKLIGDGKSIDTDTKDMFLSWIREGIAMPCPECNALIEKDEGCDWVKCALCQTEICWATRGYRWGPGGNGDTTGGCGCTKEKKCIETCNYCH